MCRWRDACACHGDHTVWPLTKVDQGSSEASPPLHCRCSRPHISRIQRRVAIARACKPILAAAPAPPQTTKESSAAEGGQAVQETVQQMCDSLRKSGKTIPQALFSAAAQALLSTGVLAGQRVKYVDKPIPVSPRRKEAGASGAEVVRMGDRCVHSTACSLLCSRPGPHAATP